MTILFILDNFECYLLICTKVGSSMGNKIETSSSTGSDYLAALRWLSENQSKWPYMKDPN